MYYENTFTSWRVYRCVSRHIFCSTVEERCSLVRNRHTHAVIAVDTSDRTCELITRVAHNR